MFRDQRFRVRRRPRQVGQGLRARRVPQRHAHITQQTAPFRSQNRRPRKPRLEPRFIQSQQLQQVRRLQIRPALRLHQFALLRKPVPRARRQAIITAINPVADRRPQLHGNRPL